MKVLIVKTSALGDVVHALPVLAWLKSAVADVQIGWLVEASFAPLLDNHPMISRVHAIDTKSWRKGGVTSAVSAFRQTMRELRAEHYDVALDLQGNSKSGAFLLCSGAPKRYGFARDGVREWPAVLASNRKVTLLPEQYHVTERSLAIARAAFSAGGQVPQAGPLFVDDAEKQTVNGLLADRGLGDRPLLVFHYGTTWQTKLWALEHWCVLAQQLTARGDVDIVLTWGNETERSAAEKIAAASQGRAVLWPRGTLKELIALLERADVVVGCDTGPVHIAAAVGTPTVSLYRVTDARRNGPRGDHHRLLQVPLACAACLRKDCERNRDCAEAITPEQVSAAIESLYSR